MDTAASKMAVGIQLRLHAIVLGRDVENLAVIKTSSCTERNGTRHRTIPDKNNARHTTGVSTSLAVVIIRPGAVDVAGDRVHHLYVFPIRLRRKNSGGTSGPQCTTGQLEVSKNVGSVGSYLHILLERKLLFGDCLVGAVCDVRAFHDYRCRQTGCVNEM